MLLPYTFLEIILCFMIKIFSSIKFFFLFFFLISFFNSTIQNQTENPSSKEFQDVFQRISKGALGLAITLADDYNNKKLSSMLDVDITRPGSNHN